MNINLRQSLTLFCCLGVLAIFSSCKKDKEELEELPVFGTCESVTPTGNLSQTSANGPFTFNSAGGVNIVIDLDNYITITHTDYPNFMIQLWGLSSQTSRLCGNHENLNGKHLKDRLGVRRSIVFPDGSKITMVADGAYANPMLWMSVYEGDESHHINVSCKTLEYSSSNASITQRLDEAEADGETATIEFTTTGALYVNIYTEETPGNKVTNRVPLAELIWAQPNMVNDLFDDPRLNHT